MMKGLEMLVHSRIGLLILHSQTTPPSHPGKVPSAPSWRVYEAFWTWLEADAPMHKNVTIVQRGVQ